MNDIEQVTVGIARPVASPEEKYLHTLKLHLIFYRIITYFFQFFEEWGFGTVDDQGSSKANCDRYFVV